MEQIVAASGDHGPGSTGAGWATALSVTADGTTRRAIGREGPHIVKPDEDTSSWNLGNHTGIGRRRAGGIEHGQENLTLEALWRLADSLQMHWADLLDDRVTDPPRGRHPSVPLGRQLKAFGTRVYHARGPAAAVSAGAY